MYTKKLFGFLAVNMVLFLFSHMSNSSPVPQWGTWFNYFSKNTNFGTQYNNNGPAYGIAGIKEVPDSLPRYDLYYNNSIYGKICDSHGTVEEYKVKTCTLTNMTTGAVTQNQFVMYLATRNALSPIRYLAQPAIFNGLIAYYFYWDYNGNGIIDANDTGYRVSCPNYGHPYALYYVDSVPYIIKVWFRGDISGGGSNFTRRLFWQSSFLPPANKFNPNYGNVGLSALSLQQSEAFWCADDNNYGCAYNGAWDVGTGTVSILSDGKPWPTGSNVQYGRTIWHAKDIAPFWQLVQWLPPAQSYGVDYAYTNPGFYGCN